MEIRMEIELDSDLLKEIEVNGEVYYKLNENADVNKIVKNAVERKIRDMLYFGYKDDNLKNVAKELCEKYREEIIKNVTDRVYKSVIMSKEGKELKGK